MKGKMQLAKSSYVPSPAIFPFNKAVFVAIVINSASFEVWFAVNACFGVTKQHHFVINKVYFVANKVYFVANKVCFVTNKVCFVTNKHCFAAKQHSFPTKKLCFVAETLINMNRSIKGGRIIATKPVRVLVSKAITGWWKSQAPSSKA